MSGRPALSWPCRFITQRSHSNNTIYLPRSWTILRAVIYSAEQRLLKSASVRVALKFCSSFPLHIQNRNGENSAVLTLLLFCQSNGEREKDVQAEPTPESSARIQCRQVCVQCSQKSEERQTATNLLRLFKFSQHRSFTCSLNTTACEVNVRIVTLPFVKGPLLVRGKRQNLEKITTVVDILCLKQQFCAIRMKNNYIIRTISLH